MDTRPDEGSPLELTWLRGFEAGVTRCRADRNQVIRELIEKAEAESYTACMAVPDEEPDQAHIAATWLKSQIEGSR